MSEPVLLTERRDGMAIVTLNRPDKLNALSRELRAAIVETFATIAGDDGVGVAVLTGNGRAFSAGLDLRELGQRDAGDEDRRSADEHMRSVTADDIAERRGAVQSRGRSQKRS